MGNWLVKKKNVPFLRNLIYELKAVVKIEKWFETKPPARRAYAPEGTVQGSEESRSQVGASKLSVRIAGRTEIGPSIAGCDSVERAIWHFDLTDK